MGGYWLYALIFAVVITVALAFYAGSLLRQLAQQKQNQQQAEKKHQQALAGHDHKVLASVLLIARAMKEEQCDFSEGCWRLSVLLGSLKTSTELESQFPAIFKLYDEIKHLKILGQRKQLSKQHRMKEDFQRMTVESQLHEQIVKDLALLQQYTTERMSILGTSS